MKSETQAYSEQYYDGNGQNGDRPALTLFTRLARRYIPKGRVMDFGCGPGFFLNHLARYYDAIGVEISPWAAEAARRRAGVVVYGATQEIPDASLDGIVSLHVIEHVPDAELQEMLLEWRRVLKPGSKVLVVTPDASGFAARRKGKDWIAYTDPTHINLKSHEQWQALFESAHFKVIHHFSDGLWDFPYVFSLAGKAEALLLGWPTLLQFVFARPLVKAGAGESSILILECVALE
jgi:SAM-dependent methyltransferase